ncbi:MAG: 1-deoxy-D-xylulose-5-phosphate synthase [Syntrophotaleaceae bacterium]
MGKQDESRAKGFVEMKGILDRIESTSDLKLLKPEDLIGLAGEIRQLIIQTVSKTGGHLASPLGAVELAIALHYFYSSPGDKIIWDVGHQSYAHKILTGRKRKFATLRQYKGISGFPKITESEHDAYGTGHASTSVSAALGFAVARDIKKEEGEVIAVIGDGSLSGGNALEAINHGGYLHKKIIVILNDNRMSISNNVGALAAYTHRIQKTEKYKKVRQKLYKIIEKSDDLKEELLSLKEYIKDIGSAGLLFEKLGFDYIGPVDGHNIDELIEAFKQAKQINGPVLIHAQTCKGKGYPIAECDSSRYHGVNPFNVENGLDVDSPKGNSFTNIFGDVLVEIADKDEKLIAITAAMADGTGLKKFKEKFPNRFFDVGIAEQHAVVFAAGLARQGLKPICVIYSTFLQRAYDALIHDVCLQNLPVVFAIDRAGLVGNDGPTHHGCFDLSYLRHIPEMILMAPKDGNELKDMLVTAFNLGKPVALRYPRGVCHSFIEKVPQQLEIGKCEVVEEGEMMTIVSIGTVFDEALLACNWLREHGVDVTLINARFVKPMDNKIAEWIGKTKNAILIEENSIEGGFGSAVLELCQRMGIEAKIELLGIPDKFIEHGNQVLLRRKCGFSWQNIVNISMKILSKSNK